MGRAQVIAVVDDDASMREAVEGLLRACGYAVEAWPSPEAFLSRGAATVGCLITDLRMPGMTGIELAREVLARGRAIPVILMSGLEDDVVLPPGVTCERMFKPFDEDALLGAVRRALGPSAS